MSFTLEGPEIERLVMNEAYNLHHHDSILTVLPLIMITLLAGCLIIAYMMLRKPSKMLIVKAQFKGVSKDLTSG